MFKVCEWTVSLAEISNHYVAILQNMPLNKMTLGAIQLGTTRLSISKIPEDTFYHRCLDQFLAVSEVLSVNKTPLNAFLLSTASSSPHPLKKPKRPVPPPEEIDSDDDDTETPPLSKQKFSGLNQIEQQKEFCKFGKFCVNQSTCGHSLHRRHSYLCSLDNNCRRPHCTFIHTRESNDRSLCLPFVPAYSVNYAKYVHSQPTALQQLNPQWASLQPPQQGTIPPPPPGLPPLASVLALNQAQPTGQPIVQNRDASRTAFLAVVDVLKTMGKPTACVSNYRGGCTKVNCIRDHGTSNPQGALCPNQDVGCIAFFVSPGCPFRHVNK